MTKERRIQFYVWLSLLGAGCALAYASSIASPVPDFWGLAALVALTFLLELASTRLRGGESDGSLAFLSHIAGGLLFGAFWAGIVAGIASILSQVLRRKPAIKFLFNVSQSIISIVVASLVYKTLGGTTPPHYLLGGSEFSLRSVLPEVPAFFLGSFTFFMANSLMVSGAIAISSDKRFREVWRTNTLWVLGYDVFSSTLAIVVAWLYIRFNELGGAGRFGFLGVFVPVIAAKRFYAKLNQLQSLYDELDRAHERLEQNVREQLAMMVKAIEARDPYTSGHSRRVAAMSQAIATEYGLNLDHVEEIENAALLHDVGKIHAEFAPLLQKEGRLTQEEWEVMKTHAGKSAELVAMFASFRGNVERAVKHHHERWDGKGYPDGVVADAIPLGARVIMISDTIDAMTTDRPYRKALTFEAVVAELIKYKGVQFDPALVDVTVNSVTVRRLVSEPGFLVEEAHRRSVARTKSRQSDPLRSQRSFLDGIRTISR